MLSTFFCTPTACELTERFMRFLVEPKQNKTAARDQVEVEKPGRLSIRLKETAPKSKIFLLLIRPNNQPVTGMVSISPIGNANNTAPSCASFKCNCCCIEGILEAQEEYPKPDIKKKTVVAILNLTGDLKRAISETMLNLIKPAKVNIYPINQWIKFCKQMEQSWLTLIRFSLSLP